MIQTETSRSPPGYGLEIGPLLGAHPAWPGRHPAIVPGGDTSGMADGSAGAVVRDWIESLCPDAPASPPPAQPQCPVPAWAASGAMALTGHPGQPPLVSPAPAFGLLIEVARVLAAATAGAGTGVHADPAVILAGRAGLLGLHRAGRVSAGGATRLLRGADGWCAITLSRQADADSVPAILGATEITDPWAELTDAARQWSAKELADRAQLLGVPAAALPPAPPGGTPWRARRIAAPVGGARLAGARVVDLSSMWAGPLCAHLLGRAGAQVVKVESVSRPDGARRGDPRFFDWLHAGHQNLTLDFHTSDGRARLAWLLDTADVVIEASRPRALAQLGLAPGGRAHRDGQVWLRITGYGHDEPDRVAFGDDAAVAGGLVGWDDHREPVFCADAVADPLAGICAALAVTCAVLGGGGQFIDLSMRATAAAFAGVPATDHGFHPVRRAGDGWLVDCPLLASTQAVLQPRAPQPGPTSC